MSVNLQLYKKYKYSTGINVQDMRKKILSTSYCPSITLGTFLQKTKQTTNFLRYNETEVSDMHIAVHGG